jgi:hypothetical protein
MDHTWLLYQSVLIHRMEQVSVDCNYSFQTVNTAVNRILYGAESLQFVPSIIFLDVVWRYLKYSAFTDKGGKVQNPFYDYPKISQVDNFCKKIKLS